MSLRSAPHVKLYQAGTLTHLVLAEWESLTHALTTGAAWWEGRTIYGATALIRLSTVTDVHFVTADAIAAADAEDSEEQFS